MSPSPVASAVVPLAGLALVIVVGCEQERAAAPPPATPPPTYAYGPAPCQPGPPTCSPDRRAVVAACGASWNLLQSCLGPAGCSAGPQGITCDESVAKPGEPCRSEGAYGCSADMAFMLQCRGGRQAVASTCKGRGRCSVGNAVACDASLADPGDACDSEGQSACARDGSVLLRCSRGTFAVSTRCAQVACMSAGGRVLCQ